MKTSWRSGVIGIASLLLGVLTAAQEPSISAAINDPHLHMAILLGLLGLVTKDFNVSGPPPQPKA